MVEMLCTYIAELLSVDLGLHNVRSVGYCVVLQLVNMLSVVHLQNIVNKKHTLDMSCDIHKNYTFQLFNRCL